jgi:DNA-binding CsgD family transcriptional regulator
MGTALNFTSRELRLIHDMQRRLIGVRSFAGIHDAIEEGMLRLCGADHLAVGFSHVDDSQGLQWKTRTVQPLLEDYSAWLRRCFVFEYTLEHPNVAARTPQLLQGKVLERTETYQRSRSVDLKLRHVLASLLFEERSKYQGGFSLYKESAREFTLRDEQLLQRFIPAINEAMGAVQELHAKDFRGDLLAALLEAAEPGLVLNADGKLQQESGPARSLLLKYFSLHELRGGVPQEWVELVKAFSRRSDIALPAEREFKVARGRDSLEVRLRPANVERPGCMLWMVRLTEHRHRMFQGLRQPLTRRESEVLDLLVAEALTDKDIADRLKVTYNTVREHMKVIRDKTGIRRRSELIAKGRS